MPDIEQTINELSKRELGTVKVLMIEDDKFIANLVAEALTKHGCLPYSGQTGEEALALAEQFHPNAIILDLMLPGMSGEAVLEALKHNDNVKDIPVVVFSNKSGEADIKNALELGAVKYLVKASTDIRTIADTIHAVVSEAESKKGNNSK
jgi:DNA-binding response OmpR family regulator